MSLTNRPPSNGNTVWTIEAWRGLAAWMVVYAHYWAGSGDSISILRFAFTGVDLFFVLSGFVFAPYLFGKPLVLGAFAIRRFFRIYPAYFLALSMYFGLKFMAGHELAYWWQHLVFAHLQSREMTFYYNPAFWSLPSEVEFYVLLPLLAIFCRGRLSHFVALTAGALVLRAIVGYASNTAEQNQPYIWMHHLPGMLIEFLLGACAWAISRRPVKPPTRGFIFGAGLALWVMLALWFAKQGDAGIDASLARGQMSWLAAISFAMMVIATVGPWPQAPTVIVNTAVWSGRLSYGCYLFHMAALSLLKPHASALGVIDVTLAAALLTVIVAWISYKFWEDPWRKVGREWAGRQ